MLQSIAWVGLAVVLYGLVAVDATSSLKSFGGFLVTATMFFSVYFMLSIFGWLLVGLPSHWLISKYTSSGYLYYVAAVIVFALAVLLMSNLPTAILFGVVALAQALIFRFLLVPPNR